MFVFCLGCARAGMMPGTLEATVAITDKEPRKPSFSFQDVPEASRRGATPIPCPYSKLERTWAEKPSNSWNPCGAPTVHACRATFPVHWAGPHMEPVRWHLHSKATAGGKAVLSQLSSWENLLILLPRSSIFLSLTFLTVYLWDWGLLPKHLSSPQVGWAGLIWVLSKFEFMSFVTIWEFEFGHNLSFWILSQFYCFSFVPTWDF